MTVAGGAVNRPGTAGVPAVGLIGVAGYGKRHLTNALRLHEQGLLVLRAAADTRFAGDEPLSPAPPGHVRRYADYRDMLAGERLDAVVVCTPLHLHAPMARDALRAGAAVLVEKPPAVTVASLDRLAGVSSDTGLACEVGFQSTASPALRRLRQAVAGGELGEVSLVVAAGAWQRDRGYYTRNGWAGRLALDGEPVLDGTLFNPFAHALMNALLVADSVGGPGSGHPEQVEAELYRANPIEADDTSSVRIRTASGVPVVAALTLCAQETAEPYVAVRGSRGGALLRYNRDELTFTDADGNPGEVVSGGRPDQLEELVLLLADGSGTLHCPVAATRDFVLAVECAFAAAGAPAALPGAAVTDVDSPAGPARHIPGIEALVRRCAADGLLLSEAGASWARANPPVRTDRYRPFVPPAAG